MRASFRMVVVVGSAAMSNSSQPMRRLPSVSMIIRRPGAALPGLSRRAGACGRCSSVSSLRWSCISLLPAGVSSLGSSCPLFHGRGRLGFYTMACRFFGAVREICGGDSVLGGIIRCIFLPGLLFCPGPAVGAFQRHCLSRLSPVAGSVSGIVVPGLLAASRGVISVSAELSPKLPRALGPAASSRRSLPTFWVPS